MAMRCSVRNLTVQDQEQYVRAVKKLKEEGKYDWYVKTHSEASDLGVAHRGPAFLPWHRQFILSFEQDLQRVLNDKSFALPYWDWTADAALSDPTKATVWSNDFMGGNGNPVTGPFSPANGWTTVDSSGKPAGGLTRNFGGSSSARTLPTSADVNAALQVSSYDVAPYDTTSAPDKSFRNRLEGWVPASTAPNLHNRVHVWVGGAMLNVPTAPNDPVFFLHHCYVDRIWALWQQKYPNAEYPKSGAPKQNLDDPMWPWNVTPAAVLNHTELGYYYDFDGSISTNWSADALIPNKDNAFGTSGTPALAVFKDKLYCIREGRGNSGWVWCASTSDGSNWSTDALIPNKDNAFGTSGTPALAVFNDKLYCAREGRGNSGWVWCAFETSSRSGNPKGKDEL